MTEGLRQLRSALTAYYERVWSEYGENDQKFADALDVSLSLVQQVRRGAKNVTVEHLAQLAALQRIPVLAVLAEVAAMLARQTAAPRGVDAPGSTQGSAVASDLAETMKRDSSGAVLPPRRPKPRSPSER